MCAVIFMVLCIYYAQDGSRGGLLFSLNHSSAHAFVTTCWCAVYEEFCVCGVVALTLQHADMK